MKKFNVVHCLFEQSGRFRDYFRSIGYEAYDYDIENMFDTTDYVVDLFSEIEKAHKNEISIFDNITSNDLIIAFFPCTYFSGQNDLFFNRTASQFKVWSNEKVDAYMVERERERARYLELLNKLVDIVENRNFKIIIENPYTNNYLLTINRFSKPKIIIQNRRVYGDYYVKPTMFYYFGLEPTYITSKAQVLKKGQKKMKVKDEVGITRSLMSKEFVENFIEKYILGVD